MKFDALLAPFPAARFAREVWGRRILHVREDSPLRRSIASVEEIDDVLHRLGGGDFLTVTSPKEGIRPPPGRPRSQEAVAPYRLYAALETGKSLRLNYAERKLPGAAAAMAAIQLFVRQHPNDATVFVSPPGGAAFPEHQDDEHTFTVQLAGTKTWRFKGRRVVLKPGQLLYVPPHLPHRAEASRSLSVSIGFGLQGLTEGDVLRRAADSLRGELPIGWDARQVSRIRAKLKDLDLGEVLEDLADLALRETPPLCEGRLGRRPGTSSRFERRVELRVRRSKGACRVSFPGGGDLRLPATAYATFAWLGRSKGPFRISEVPGPDARSIVSQLAALGVLADVGTS